MLSVNPFKLSVVIKISYVSLAFISFKTVIQKGEDSFFPN